MQWQTTLDGVIGDIEPFSDGTYVLVDGPSRSLTAIGISGKVLWKIDLD